MKDQLQIIRRAVTAALSDDQPYIEACKKALTALSELEQMVGEQEPVAWRVHPFDYGIGHEGVYATTHLTQQRDAIAQYAYEQADAMLAERNKQ